MKSRIIVLLLSDLALVVFTVLSTLYCCDINIGFEGGLWAGFCFVLSAFLHMVTLAMDEDGEING